MASRQVEVERRDEAFPFSAISQEDLLLLQTSVRRLVADEDGSLYLRLGSLTSGVLPSRKTQLRGRKPHQSPSPSIPPTPRREFSHYSYSALPPTPAPPRSVSHYSRRGFSFPWLFCLSWLPIVTVVIFGSFATMSLHNLFSPLTMSLGNVVSNIADINPVETIHAIVSPAVTAIGSIPIKDIWCNRVGLGCPGEDRNTPFTTSSFQSLDLDHPAHEISLGNDFFDCLSDLRITREQDKAVSQ